MFSDTLSNRKLEAPTSMPIATKLSRDRFHGTIARSNLGELQGGVKACRNLCVLS